MPTPTRVVLTKSIVHELRSINKVGFFRMLKRSPQDLSGFTHIEDDAAQELGTFADQPWMPEAAETPKGTPSGFDDYNEDFLRFVDRFLLSSLCLDGLIEISDLAAAELSKWGASLSLSGLTSLSVPAARNLSRHKGKLILNGIRDLPDVVAEELGNHDGTLVMNGLVSLSISAAHQLTFDRPALSCKNLTLNGVRELPDAVARELSELRGDLQIDGVQTISEAAAQHLAHIAGRLHLSGCEKLDDATIAAISNHTGHLTLGIKSLSAMSANALGRRSGDLTLSQIEEIPEPAALHLSNFRGILTLPRVKGLSRKTALHLGKINENGGAVYVHGERLTSVSYLKWLWSSLKSRNRR